MDTGSGVGHLDAHSDSPRPRARAWFFRPSLGISIERARRSASLIRESVHLQELRRDPYFATSRRELAGIAGQVRDHLSLELHQPKRPWRWRGGSSPQSLFITYEHPNADGFAVDDLDCSLGSGPVDARIHVCHEAQLSCFRTQFERDEKRAHRRVEGEWLQSFYQPSSFLALR
jgi:hypothetical protein